MSKIASFVFMVLRYEIPLNTPSTSRSQANEYKVTPSEIL